MDTRKEEEIKEQALLRQKELVAEATRGQFTRHGLDAMKQQAPVTVSKDFYDEVKASQKQTGGLEQVPPALRKQMKRFAKKIRAANPKLTEEQVSNRVCRKYNIQLV